MREKEGKKPRKATKKKDDDEVRGDSDGEQGRVRQRGSGSPVLVLLFRTKGTKRSAVAARPRAKTRDKAAAASSQPDECSPSRFFRVRSAIRSACLPGCARASLAPCQPEPNRTGAALEPHSNRTRTALEPQFSPLATPHPFCSFLSAPPSSAGLPPPSYQITHPLFSFFPPFYLSFSLLSSLLSRSSFVLLFRVTPRARNGFSSGNSRRPVVN